MDLCFELAAQIMARIGDAVTAVDEVHGFRYFDDRDLLGFVDGTENPRGAGGDRRRAHRRRRTPPSPAAATSSCRNISTISTAGTRCRPKTQERIIGRTKLSDIELDDAVKPTSAHNALTTIVENGKEIKILRDNMPFGRVGDGRIRHLFHRL